MKTPITSQQRGESTDDWRKREADARNYLALQSRLAEEYAMIGWLCTIHRNVVSYPNADPADVQKIQRQLDKASNLIAITYIWALLDEGGFNENAQWVSADDRLELKAWKHVRHTGAHAPGKRAGRYHKEFDQYMKGRSSDSSGLRQNCRSDTNSIELADGMSYSFFTFARHMVDKALGASANYKGP